MPNYLVRNRETERAIGIFAVHSFAELIDAVKRVEHLEVCEYALLGARPPSGGEVFKRFPASGVAPVANDP